MATLSKKRYNKPLILPFSEDVQCFQHYLEKKSVDLVGNLEKSDCHKTYAALCKVTLAQIILFNRRRAGEVANMKLECFQKRDQSELHTDVAASLSPFEVQLAKYFSRVEVMGKKGSKVAMLLNPAVVNALTLLEKKRNQCQVHKDNNFLFGIPKASSKCVYRGHDCLRDLSKKCGAKKPSHLRSTLLRKQLATLFQILSLKDNEEDIVAKFLGHDIRVVVG